MSQFTHHMINGQRVELTAEEITELETQAAQFVPKVVPTAPTKEQLMAELAALTAKIQALE